MDTCTSVPAQRTVTDFRAGGHLKQHLKGVPERYRERKNAMRASLQGHFGDGVSTIDPDGGYFLWATFSEERVDTPQKGFEAALSEGVVYIPAARSYVPPPAQTSSLLNVGGVRPTDAI